MRKYLFILISVLLLAACGNEYYKEVRATFGEDTESIINIVLESNEDGRQLTESEEEKVDSYTDRYENQLESIDETEAYLSTINLTLEQNDSLLPSEKEEVKVLANEIQMILKDGRDEYRDHIEQEAEKRNKEKDALRRDGIDRDFAQDALEIAETVDYWFNDLDVMYDELPEDTYNFIRGFDPNIHLGYEEELSEEEEDIYTEVIVLVSGYQLHGTESEEGLRDLTDSVNENIERIRELTSSVAK